MLWWWATAPRPASERSVSKEHDSSRTTERRGTQGWPARPEDNCRTRRTRKGQEEDIGLAGVARGQQKDKRKTEEGQEEDTGLASTARGQQQDKWTHYILHLSQPPESLGGLAELVLFLEPL